MHKLVQIEPPFLVSMERAPALLIIMASGGMERKRDEWGLKDVSSQIPKMESDSSSQCSFMFNYFFFFIYYFLVVALELMLYMLSLQKSNYSQYDPTSPFTNSSLSSPPSSVLLLYLLLSHTLQFQS